VVHFFYVNRQPFMIMNLKKTYRTIAVSMLLFLVTAPTQAQDLLARQAPVDRKMKAVDTLVLKSITERENANSPASQLYETWNNKSIREGEELPDSFVINLRHFCMPTPSRVITSNFGPRWGREHAGLDIKVYIGDTIRAAFSGKVRIVRYDGGGYGNFVVIRHPNGLETLYGHMSKQLVEEDQTVKAGEPIGLGGNTGRSTGSHLHFETRLCGVAINPALMFDFRNQDVTGDTYYFNKRTYARESSEATRERGKVGNGGYSREQVKGEMAVNSNIDNATALYYRVSKGDTISSIAKKRGVSEEQIIKLNHFGRAIRLVPGQIIRYS
jgi:murein DD-endopeptidase MepM/ murein hydrolase activator NlpD